jgi:hypothetical protein
MYRPRATYQCPHSLKAADLSLAGIFTDAGDKYDIHPRDKRIPGARFAAMALSKVYKKQASPMALPSNP